MLRSLHKNLAVEEPARSSHSTHNIISDLGIGLLSLLAEDKLKDPTEMSAAIVNATNLTKRLGRSENALTSIMDELEILENLGLVKNHILENTNRKGYQFIRYQITQDGLARLKELNPDVLQNTKPIVAPFLDRHPSYL